MVKSKEKPNVAEAIDLMTEWANSFLRSEDALDQLSAGVDAGVAHINMLKYLAKEITQLQPTLDILVVRLTNTIRAINVVGDSAIDELGQEFARLVPPPPLKIEKKKIKTVPIAKRDLN